MRNAVKIVFILSCCLLTPGVFAQDGNDVKESKKLYKSLSSSSSNPRQLLRDAEKIKYTNPLEALNKVKEALGISIARNDEFGEARCYLMIGEINESIQEWKLALDNYQLADQKLAKGSPKERVASDAELLTILKGLGSANLHLGNYQAALSSFERALKLRPGTQNERELQLNISEVYYRMEKYDEALKPLTAIPQVKIYDQSFETRLQNQQAKIYARKNDLSKTRDLYSNSINSLKTQDAAVNKEEEKSLQTAKEEIVDVLRDNNLYDDEIYIRNQSIELNTKTKNFAEVTNDKVEISKTLESKGENNAAILEMEEAAAIADTLHDPKAQANAFLSLADLYERNGRNTLAISAYKKYSKAVTEYEKQNESQLLERSSIISKQRDIEELSKDVSVGRREYTIEQQTVFRQQLIIYGLLVIVLITSATSYFIYKNAQASKIANQLLALKSLRSQMNPHFIFNALNSVNHFIAQQDERTANKFLSEFSQLMRLVLENSQEDFIPLYKEQEILTLYLKLEHYRFRDKFEYEIRLDKDINIEAIEVPPMLIQPYIENAVWHGLRYKEEKGKLSLSFNASDDDLVVAVEDNGIGRKKSAELKTENQRKHNSTGLKNIQDRLSIINRVYHANYRVTIEDLPEGTGTRVLIFLPLNRKNTRML